MFVSVGWISRGWLETQANSWASLQFTLMVAVPIVASVLWFSFSETLIKSGAFRIPLNLVIVILLVVWEAALDAPSGYSWIAGLPALAALLVGLLLGISLLAVVKPNLASWPWWK
jgi:hypothetical protein